MTSLYNVVRVFISSPGDMGEERMIAERVIKNVSTTCRDTLGIMLDYVVWEQQPPLTNRKESIQEGINKKLRSCNAFLLLLNRRYGSMTDGEAKSNTEREVEIALEMLKEDDKFLFLSYFHRLENNPDPGVQEKHVRELREKLSSQKGVLYKEYSRENEFENLLTNNLYSSILTQRFNSQKQTTLRKFWKLGISEGMLQPEVSIIYPAIDRSYLYKENPDQIWSHTLTPHIVFEDYKAIQKIENNIREIGVREVHAYGTLKSPDHLNLHNRVWICLPRNKLGQTCLESSRRDGYCSFRFPAKKGRDKKMYWKYSPNASNEIEIISPLNKYLKIQRRSIGYGGSCTARHLEIIAKDFAIIARFPDNNTRPMESGKLYDYYFAGIRGLGTWGAAKTLDTYYHLLEPYLSSGNPSIQMILEITYKRGRISKIIDVTNEPETYFKEQNSFSMIKKIISEENLKY